jgi:hypothetical protein
VETDFSRSWNDSSVHGRETIYKILVEELGKRKISANDFPSNLADKHEVLRLQPCQELIHSAEDHCLFVSFLAGKARQKAKNGITLAKLSKT